MDGKLLTGGRVGIFILVGDGAQVRVFVCAQSGACVVGTSHWCQREEQSDIFIAMIQGKPEGEG